MSLYNAVLESTSFLIRSVEVSVTLVVSLHLIVKLLPD